MRAGILFTALLLAACGDSTGSSRPAAVGIVSGNGQGGTVASLVPNPLVVRVTNAGGSPVQGVTVSWAVTAGGGSLTAASSVTGADGQAQVQWLLGTRTEAQTVTATVEGLAPAVFTITPAPGPFERVTLSPDSTEVAGVNQSATFRASFSDSYGNATERPGAIIWTSLDESVARLVGVSATEVQAVARAAGRARILVRTANRADTAVFRVRP